MSHIREGEIHAYLDGALERLGDARAAEVREHLAACEDCRRRLEEERLLRGEADRLLDLGAPVGLEMPPFEEMLRRAGAGPADQSGPGVREAPESVPPAGDTPSGSVRRFPLAGPQRLAWAASLVLALGTGWVLRGTDLAQQGRANAEFDQPMTSATSPGPAGAAESLGPPVPEDESFEEATEVPTEALTQAPTEALSPVPAEASADPTLGSVGEAQSRSDAARGLADQLGARELARTEVAATAPAVAPDSQAFRQALERDQLVDAAPRRRVLADSTAVAPATMEAAARARVVESEAISLDEIVVTGAASASDPGQASADSSGGAWLAPGLALLEMIEEAQSVRVTQLFPEGDTLEMEFVGSTHRAWRCSGPKSNKASPRKNRQPRFRAVTRRTRRRRRVTIPLRSDCGLGM